MIRMTKERAETLALGALAMLAGDPELLEPFLAQSGADLSTLRQRVAEPGLLSAVLDFVLADDTRVQSFCEGLAISVQELHLARHRLTEP